MRMRARADLIEDVLTAQPQSREGLQATQKRIAQLRSGR